MNNESVFKREVAESMLDEIAKSVKHIAEQATFGDDLERAAVMRVYATATKELQSMLEAAGPDKSGDARTSPKDKAKK